MTSHLATGFRSNEPADFQEQLARTACEVQAANGGLSGAEFLHANLSADYWGLTMGDIHEFVAIVTESLRAGELKNRGAVPYSDDKFNSNQIGPSMYQVNDQIIKPVTADPNLELPGLSWALKGRPCGTKVSLFVTHAWAEGICEFYHGLQEVWPAGAEASGAAYICFLSNPQNLDISAMLSSIEDSPFNVALRRMPDTGKMLMIPTANTAIHGRLWCVFEAHVAKQLRVPILLGGSSTDLAADPKLALDDKAAMKSQKPALFAITFFLILLFMVAWGLAIIALDDYTPTGFYLKISGVVLVLDLLLLWYFLRCSPTCRQARELAKKDHIDVCEAKCSDPVDEQQIRTEIRGHEAGINEMLNQLIKHGKVLPTSEEQRKIAATNGCLMICLRCLCGLLCR